VFLPLPVLQYQQLFMFAMASSITALRNGPSPPPIKITDNAARHFWWRGEMDEESACRCSYGYMPSQWRALEYGEKAYDTIVVKDA
jgi:hypothetical protein